MGVSLRAALSRLPADLPRRHLGRTPDGMDCVGFILWLYKQTGRDIDFIDADYPESDKSSPARIAFLCDRILGGGFADVTDKAIRGWFKDGDILILEVRAGHAHAGIVIDGFVHQMAQTRVKIAVDRVRPFIISAYRLAA